MSATRIVEDVACTVCGCVCDDLRLTIQGDRIAIAEGACHLARDWFLDQDRVQPPQAEIDGTAAAWDDAIAQSARLLSAARWPLVFGLSRSSTEGQRAAIRLADMLGANIDTTASLCHAPSIEAIQTVGESTCTLGEVKNRADLVIFWGVDPDVSHPRHAERYSVEPVGMFLPRGRADRTLIVIDEQRTAASDRADIFVRVEPGMHFEVLWTLRYLLRGEQPEPGCLPGAPLRALRDLCQRMRSCRYGIVFFGLGLARARSGHSNVEALLQLVAELNAHARFSARRMRIPGDVAGADTVLCWQTGFPFAVNLSRGYPRYGPGEFSANEMLERGEVDACLMVGSEGAIQMSARAQKHLARIPTIVLDHPTVTSLGTPAVRFTTSVYGIHLPGTAYRMDEVPIRLRPVLPPRYPSDADVLDAIAARLVADWPRATQAVRSC